MKIIKPFIIFITLACIVINCREEDKELPKASEIELYGVITDKQTKLPLSGVIVQLSKQIGMGVMDVTKTHTDSIGKYYLKFQQESSGGYSVEYAKEFYGDDVRIINTYLSKQEYNIELERDSTNWVNKK